MTRQTTILEEILKPKRYKPDGAYLHILLGVVLDKNQPSLLQVLGLSTAILLVSGNIIGSGIYKKIGPMSAGLMDSNLILLAWFAAGIITMFGAFTYASLATTTNEAGGQFQYFKNAFGDFFGFLFGWGFFTVIGTSSIASISYVFAESVVNLFQVPEILTNSSSLSVFGIHPFQNFTVKMVAVATLVLLTMFNIRGVKGGGWLSNTVTGAKILGILFLIVIGVTYTGGAEHALVAPKVVAVPEIDAHNVFMLSAFFTAMLGAFWAYDGWANITNMASEFKNPTRNLPIAIISGTIITMFLYISVNYAYLRVLTPTDFAAISADEGKIAAVEVATAALGNSGTIIISVLIIISTFGAMQASTMSAARVCYQMAREGQFFTPFSKVHARFRTPYVSLLWQMLWAGVLILSGSFDQLTDMLIFAAFIFYGLGAIAVFRLKRRRWSITTFGYPYIPALFLLSCIVIVANALYTRPYESFIGLGLIFLGVPFYLYFRARISVSSRIVV